jgi:predicted lipoprotein with Yx(FWY)xxD motif
MRDLNKLITMLIMFCVSVFFFASFATAATLTVMTKDGVGSYLADDKGMALYLFKKDAAGKSMCGTANGCIEKWPAFFTEAAEQKSGVDPAAVGVITRDDGTKQTTYKGQPLYYFFKDKSSGDILGQGVNSVWYVVAP